MKTLFKQVNFDLIWLWLSLFVCLASLFYFIYQLDTISLVLSLLFSYLPIKYLIKEKTKTNYQKEINEKSKNIYSKILLISYFIFLASSFFSLFLSRTDQAIISPWSVVPPVFFLFFCLAVFSLILYFNQIKKPSQINKVALFFLYLLVFSVALIVYKIGYGFDPFIHEASIRHIIEHGFILPKTPYYIGQYSIIAALNQLLALPLGLINKIIVPLLAALLIPCLIYKFLNKIVETEAEKLAIPLVIVLSLLLGFAPFIISTPQNLAYLFLMATIVFNLNRQVLPFGLISALATFFIHPLAGLPAILFCLSLIGQKYLISQKLKIFWSWLIPIITSLIVPLSLIIGGGADFNLNFNFSWPTIFWLNQENLILNFIYFFAHNAGWLLIIMIIVALLSQRKSQFYSQITDSLKMSLAIFIAAALSLSLTFQKLINYEQTDYAQRIAIMAFLFLLPLIWLFFLKIIVKIKKSSRPIKFLIFFYLALILTASLYLSYPRQDNYHNSRGYSLSSHDLETVSVIADWAENDYIVLANQSVAVAAIKEKGFDNYFNNQTEPLYFYSIPTGGPLYQFYLDMVYQEANRQTMIKAMDLASVNEAYLVINHYWWASQKIIKEAKLWADDYKSIDQGKIKIFRYLK